MSLNEDLQDEAKKTARALGHSLVAFIAVRPEQYHSFCGNCLDDVYVNVRVFNRPSISGPAAILRCRAHETRPAGLRCRYCGDAITDKLCRAPDRMGPCAA